MTIKGIENKATMLLEEISQVANRKINKQYPQNQSLQMDQLLRQLKSRKGGTDVHIEKPHGTMETHSFPTEMNYSNYRAEATVFEHAASLVKKLT
ncbi:hypothetical protein PoB_003358400 [Plakobranchus ocellatus]|uniref:Uncharacterized protein n=1 Tax=Plakobranchus ocellatus TaxID=259542 RepID=A0AAV4ALG3_9GAST|nr:hypothetical protein PoB_003358400 [Plakobranchus ocellatus]